MGHGTTGWPQLAGLPVILLSISDTFREHTVPPALLHGLEVPALVLGWFALTW